MLWCWLETNCITWEFSRGVVFAANGGQEVHVEQVLGGGSLELVEELYRLDLVVDRVQGD